MTRLLPAAPLLLLLIACGGGSGTTTVAPPPPPPPGPTPETASLSASTSLSGTTQNGNPTANSNTDPLAGDSATNVEMRGHVSFLLSAIPTGATITQASLALNQIAVVGTPYADFTQLFLDHFDMGPTFEGADHNTAPLTANLGPLLHDSSLGYRALDVTARVQADWAALRPASSFRLRFVGAPSLDSAGDIARFSLSATSTRAVLSVTYTPP